MTIRPLSRLATGLALAFTTAASMGCNSDALTTVNDNPNNPTDAPPGPLFTSAVASGVRRWMGGYNFTETSAVVQHLAMNQYTDEDRYAGLRASATTGNLDGAYANELQDLRQLAVKGQAQNAPGIWGPARVMQSWEFQVMTDAFGDLPYTEALKGDSGTLTPKYDAQKDIYAGLLAALQTAATGMAGASGSATLGTADPVYGGDLLRWQRFANGLRARLALQLVNVDRATADAQLRAALAGPGGVFQSNAENAKLVWPGDGVNDNPWAVNLKTRDDRRMSRTLMTVLLATSDPRTAIYAQPVVDSSMYRGGYGGMPNGLLADSAGKWTRLASRPGAIFFPGVTTYGTYGSASGLSTPSYLLTYAEVLFIQAEAAERALGGLATGQAPALYRAAVTASLEQWGVTSSAAVSAFLAQPDVAYKGGTEGLKQIAVQKWVALYGNGPQAWNEWRRTCQPSTIKPGPSAVVSYVPRRFYYSTNEASSNAANLNDAIARQGPDDFKARVYWDKSPTAAPTYVDAATCGPTS
jgi:hypothetical protein